MALLELSRRGPARHPRCWSGAGADMVFDVLCRAGTPLIGLSYVERRAVLDQLALDRPELHASATFTDSPGELVMASVAQ